MQTLSELYRLLNNIIRFGVVAHIDLEPAVPLVRITSGDNTTGWLPWITTRAANTITWNPPVLGEQVMLFSPGGDLNQAAVLTGLYSEANPAPQHSADILSMQLPDKSFIAYDHAQKQLTVALEGNTQLQIKGDTTLTIGGNAAIKVKGNATVDAQAIQLNGGKGVVTGAHICQYTGSPHSDCSSTVTAGQ